MTSKADHVRNARQTRNHCCHWPGCNKQVKPAMWGCYVHWKKVPARFRRRIWSTYQPGQENGEVRVSEEYLEVARELQDWILCNGDIS